MGETGTRTGAVAVALGDGLLAGTGPSGLVYRIGDAATRRCSRAPANATSGRSPTAGGGGVWAATGTQGRLMRIEDGAARIVFDSEESNLLCLAADGAGGVYAGGDSKGRVYHTTAAAA